MKIENIEVYGFKSALRGMRNAKESWHLIDSRFMNDISNDVYIPWLDEGLDTPWSPEIEVLEWPKIGPADMKLAKTLIKGGKSHRKFLRQIQVWWDITIPRAIWQELDTYKVATVRNSCSTMHKLGTRDLTKSDFQDEEITTVQLQLLNQLGKNYREDKTTENLHAIKMQLPESFLQKATYTFNYETAITIYYDRMNHRMKEWSGPGGICEYLAKLPYFKEFFLEI